MKRKRKVRKQPPAKVQPVEIAAPLIQVDPAPEEQNKPSKTPEILAGIRIRQKVPPSGHLHVIIVFDPKTGRECEVFAHVGKAGGIPAGNMEAICRMVSSFLRIDGSLEAVIDQLDGIGSTMSVSTADGQVQSLGDALGKALRKYLEAKEKYGYQAILLGEVDFTGGS